MAYADIRQIAGVVQTGRYVSGEVSHVVIDAGIPAYRELRDKIADTRRRLLKIDASCERNRSYRAGERGIQARVVDAVKAEQADGRLTAEERRRKHVSRNDHRNAD